MGLTFKPPGRSRERILSFGPEGTGKTSDVLTIARLLPDVTFHWIDNDNSLDRLLETEFSDLGVFRENGEETGEEGNISLWTPEDWEDHVEAFVWIFGDRPSNKTSGVDHDDWVVLDNGSIPWDLVQDWASQNIYGVSKDELTERRGDERRGDKKNLMVFEGEMDYGGKINPQYRRYLGGHLTRPPCHLYVTADMVALDDRDKDKLTKSLYGKYGVKPRGQKRMGQSMQTVLMKEQSTGGQYKITTIKDRGRTRLANEVISDIEDGGFAKDYLRGVAGWKPSATRITT